ncbi:hypothetical protein FRB94_011126 [Tulasnella sp. JGI-2019a]|nr:hypothetical protein FRB94_011126 [Tulasnella sp. JGI-2019a]
MSTQDVQILLPRTCHLHGFRRAIDPIRLERLIARQAGPMDAIYMWTSPQQKEHAFVIFKDAQSALRAMSANLNASFQCEQILNNQNLRDRLHSIVRGNRRFFQDICRNPTDVPWSPRYQQELGDSESTSRTKRLSERGGRGTSTHSNDGSTEFIKPFALGGLASDMMQVHEQLDERRGRRARVISPPSQLSDTEDRQYSAHVRRSGALELGCTDLEKSMGPEAFQVASERTHTPHISSGRDDLQDKLDSLTSAASAHISMDKSSVTEPLLRDTPEEALPTSDRLPSGAPAMPRRDHTSQHYEVPLLSICTSTSQHKSKKTPTQPRAHPLLPKPQDMKPSPKPIIPSPSIPIKPDVSLDIEHAVVVPSVFSSSKSPEHLSPDPASILVDPGQEEDRIHWHDTLDLIRSAYIEDPVEAHRFACLHIIKNANEGMYDTAEAIGNQCIKSVLRFEESTGCWLSLKGIYLALADVKIRRARHASGPVQEAFMAAAARLIDLAESEDGQPTSLNLIRLSMLSPAKPPTAALIPPSFPESEPSLNEARDRGLSVLDPCQTGRKPFESDPLLAHIAFVESLYSNTTAQLGKEQSSKRKAEELLHEEKLKRRRIGKELGDVVDEKDRLEQALGAERVRRRKAEDDAWEVKKYHVYGVQETPVQDSRAPLVST